MSNFNLIATVGLFLLVWASCEQEILDEQLIEKNPIVEAFGPKVKLINEFGSTVLEFGSEEHFIKVYNRIALGFDSEQQRIIGLLEDTRFQNVQKVLQNNPIDSIYSNFPNLISKSIIDGEQYEKIIGFPSLIGLLLNADAQLVIGEDIVQFTETNRLSINRSKLETGAGKVDLREYPNADVFLTTSRKTANSRACTVNEYCEVFWLSGNRRTNGAVVIFVPSAGGGTLSTLFMSVTNYKKVFLGWKEQAAGELGMNWNLTINSVLYVGYNGPFNTHHTERSIYFSAPLGTCPTVSGSVTVYAHEHNCTMYPTG